MTCLRIHLDNMDMFSKENAVAQHVQNIHNNLDEYERKSKKKATRNKKYIQNLHQKYMLHAKLIEDIDNTYSEIRFIFQKNHHS
jgi:glycerol-3-phosphate responsive antiterminator